MKKSLVFLLSVGTLVISSCSEDVFPTPDKEQYNKSFTELFGKVNSDEDWNAFRKMSVTVNSSSSADIKVYQKMDGVYYTVGTWTNVVGSKTLTFDGPENATEFIVSDGTSSVIATDGATVYLGGTRAIKDDVKNVFTKVNEYKTFSREEVQAFAKLVPEGKNNQEVAGLQKNFSATQKDGGKTRIYPVYWNGAYKHTFGVYYYVNGKKVEVDILTDKDSNDDMCQFYTTRSGEQKNGGAYHEWSRNKWQNFYSNGYAALPMDGNDIHSNVSQIRSKGIELTIPEGVKFGFYVRSQEGTFYSESDLNKESTPASKASFFRASTTGENGRTFLGFDDCTKGDNDLNDFVIVFDPEPAIVNEESSYSCLLTCEDLGDTADYDFNDVVFEVSYTRLNGETTDITVTPLAAGGILSAEIFLGDERVGEIHEMLGSAPGNFVNTQKDRSLTKGEPVKIKNVPKNFTLSEATPESIGGFYVKVAGQNQPIALPSHKGQAPMMMCLPASWEWPVETNPINTAYKEFNGNLNGNDWYGPNAVKDESLIIKR